MNEIIKSIVTRRSIRSYTDEIVSKDDLNQIIEAGKYAACGMGRQPWKFVVIQKEEILKSISRVCSFNGKDPIYGANTLIVVFADKEKSTRVNDGTLALGNMMLAAHSLGLGSCWINSLKDYFIKEEGISLINQLNIANYECIGSIIIGHIDGEIPAVKERIRESVLFLD